MLIDGTLTKKDIKDGKLTNWCGKTCDLSAANYTIYCKYRLRRWEYMVLIENKGGIFNNEGINGKSYASEHALKTCKWYDKILIDKHLYNHIATIKGMAKQTDSNDWLYK